VKYDANKECFNLIKLMYSVKQSNDFHLVLCACAALLSGQQTTSSVLGVNFCDSTQAVGLRLITREGEHAVSVSAPCGELLQPNTLTQNDFIALQSEWLYRG